MPNVLKMEKQVLIRQLLGLGWSYRRIERETGIRRETVARYDPERSGSSSEAMAAKVPPEVEGALLENRPKCPPVRRPTRVSAAAVYHGVIEPLLEQGLSAQRIYQDLVTECGYSGSYDSVKRYVRRLRARHPEVYARLHTAPGEEAQVDFGEGARTLKGGRYRRPWLFKMSLSFSRHSYEEVVWHQDVATFIACHENAFAAFGGVVAVVRHDNLKSAVLRAHLYEPELNPAYAAYARHMGFVPVPCLPGRPEHKGKVERGIGYTQDNALKGLRFDSLEEQNAHLKRWNRTWARTRIHGTTKRQVWALFEEVERRALRPLPEACFEYFQVGRRKVHADGHVEVQRAYYSVPHRLVGLSVAVHVAERWVRVMHEGQVVAHHHRISVGRFRSEASHLPEHKNPDARAFRERLLARCRRIGPDCLAWAEAVILSRGVHGLRPVQGVVGLERKHPAERVDEACRSALAGESLRYHTVALLCSDAAYAVAREATPEAALLEAHDLMRPLTEYQLHFDGLLDADQTAA